MKKKLNLDSPFFWKFSADPIPKATKDVRVHFFIYSDNCCKLYQRIPVNYTWKFREGFEATTYFYIADGDTQLKNTHNMHSCVSIATMITRKRHNTLYALYMLILSNLSTTTQNARPAY
jgi:hypothetical protein